jgi:hypothetical protein
VRTTNVLALGAAVLASAAACGGSSSGGQPAATGGSPSHPSSLVGDVGKGDAFVISLTDQAGQDVSSIAAGTYQLTVHDESSIHNFHVSGSGLDDATTVPEKTTKTFTLNLTAGTYTFLCDAHPTQMKGSFTVS